MSPRTVFIEAAYLVASILFVLGLRSLTVPDRARRGMQLAALGMLVAIVGTLVQHLAKDGKLVLDPADEIAGPMLVVHGGKVRP